MQHPPPPRAPAALLLSTLTVAAIIAGCGYGPLEYGESGSLEPSGQNTGSSVFDEPFPEPDSCYSGDGALMACEPSPPVSRYDRDCERRAAASVFEVGGVCQPRHPQWSCPPDWIERSVALPATPFDHDPTPVPLVRWCEPQEAPRTCPSGHAPSLGGARCVRLSDACPEPEDPWPSIAEIRARAPEHRGRIWFVAGDARPGGDGTRGAPFNRVAEALDVAGAGHIVALGRGTWSEPIVLERAIAIVGACVSQTHIEPPPNASAIEVRASVAQVSDLTIRGGDRPVDVTSHARAVRMTRLVLERGLLVDQSSDVDLDHVWVRTTPGAASEVHTTCLDVREGAAVTAQRLTIDGCAGAGISVRGRRSAVRLVDSIVRASSEGAPRGAGVGLLVDDRGWVDAERVLVSDHGDAGVFVTDGTLRLVDAVIAGNRAGFDAGTPAAGLRLGTGGAADLSGVALLDQDIAVVTAAGSEVELIDVVARQTGSAVRRPPASALSIHGGDATIDRVALVDLRGGALSVAGSSGVHIHDFVATRATDVSGFADAVGIRSRDGSRVTGTGVYVAGFPRAGVEVWGPEGGVRLSAVTLIDNGWDDERTTIGGAVIATDQAEVTLNEALIERSTDTALVASHSATLRVRNALVAGVAPQPSTGRFGAGGLALAHGRMTLEQVVIRDVAGFGVMARDRGTELLINDSVIAVAPEARSTEAGRGVEVVGPAVAELRRVRIDGAVDVGVAVLGHQPRVELANVTVTSVEPAACDSDPADGCPPSGACVAFVEDARAGLDGVELRRCAFAGLHVMGRPTLDVTWGRVSDSAVAVAGDGTLSELLALLAPFTLDGVDEAARDGVIEGPTPTAGGEVR